jgi:hypothetical protein
MTSLPKPPRQSYKAFLWDYDSLLAYSDDECCYSLSEREIQILLAQIDPIAWRTRYKPTSTEIDVNLLTKWQGNLARKLMSGCCPDNDELHRYLPDGTYQTSTDGGETWDDDPTADPRYGAPLAPPLSGANSEAKRCAAADNIREQFEDMRDGTIDLLTAGTTTLLIVSFLVGLLGGILSISVVGVSFGVMLFALAGYMLSLTPESVAEQLDAEVMDQFRCLVYCRLGTDGRMSDSALAALLADIASTFTDFPETFFYSIVASLGATGISNAATMGLATASDCGDCECPNQCIHESNIIVGTLVSQTETSITIDAVLTTYASTLAYWVVYGSEGSGYCCTLCSQVWSPDIDSGSWYDCDGVHQTSISPINNQVRRIQFSRAAATFQITFDFVEGAC